ncbi:hypothetical protein LX36DRAFT_717536 [Colletotrichum falcatum]|nr:hypothetical protein LX36DRAFT_717536 [Colletotrichum falcatum]
MYPTYPLLVLFWSLLSLLSYTFAAAQENGPALEKRRGSPQAKGLRNDKDVYTVKAYGTRYEVFSPYYNGHAPVAIFIFPTKPGERDQIVIDEAMNDYGNLHDDKLHLSDMIRFVASARFANRPLRSVNRIVARDVTATFSTLKSLYEHMPGGKIPHKITIEASDAQSWSAVKATTPYKDAARTFKDIKTIKSVTINSRPPYDSFYKADVSCELENV